MPSRMPSRPELEEVFKRVADEELVLWEKLRAAKAAYLKCEKHYSSIMKRPGVTDEQINEYSDEWCEESERLEKLKLKALKDYNRARDRRQRWGRLLFMERERTLGLAGARGEQVPTIPELPEDDDSDHDKEVGTLGENLTLRY